MLNEFIKNRAWDKFIQSGSIKDYLAYRRICEMREEEISDEFDPDTEGDIADYEGGY